MYHSDPSRCARGPGAGADAVVSACVITHAQAQAKQARPAIQTTTINPSLPMHVSACVHAWSSTDLCLSGQPAAALETRAQAQMLLCLHVCCLHAWMTWHDCVSMMTARFAARHAIVQARAHGCTRLRDIMYARLCPPCCETAKNCIRRTSGHIDLKGGVQAPLPLFFLLICCVPAFQEEPACLHDRA